MEPGHFVITSGDTEEIAFTIMDEHNARVDLTGAEAYFAMRQNAKEVGNEFEMNVNMNDPDNNLSEGYLVMKIAARDNCANPGKYTFQLQITWSDGRRKTAIGTVDVIGDLSR